MNLPIDKLAEKIASEALDSQDPAYRLDAFKALSQYDIGIRRISSRRTNEDDSDGVVISLPEMISRTRAADTEKPLVASAIRRADGESRERDRNGKYT